MGKKVSIIVPTYNERENIKPLMGRVDNALRGEDYEIIIVDDNSPDGTAEAVEEISRKDERIKLLRRAGKLGLGSAILDGARISEGEYIVMIDADLSHDPKDLRKLIDSAQDADIVIGSRYIEGGKITGWPLKRRIVSKVAISLSKWLFGLSVKDTTSGFALLRRELFEEIKGNLDPRGFKLLLEILVKSPQSKVVEVPITFTDRAKGKSKLRFGEIINYIHLCYLLRKKSKR